MTTKIEGFRIGDYGFTKFPPNDAPDRATLVIHDEYAEPVYTASEVRAIAMQAIGMIRAAAKTGIHVGQACGYVGKACADAGITIDPA